MRKRFWKWLRNWLDSAGTWFEEAAYWVYIHKVLDPAPPIPADRIDNLDPTKWYPQEMCTCTWNKVSTPDSSFSTYAHLRDTNANCPFHGENHANL